LLNLSVVLPPIFPLLIRPCLGFDPTGFGQARRVSSGRLYRPRAPVDQRWREACIAHCSCGSLAIRMIICPSHCDDQPLLAVDASAAERTTTVAAIGDPDGRAIGRGSRLRGRSLPWPSPVNLQLPAYYGSFALRVGVGILA
jgi:hypothetical protein